jgi:Ala-tRNA(Pro) deacylase
MTVAARIKKYLDDNTIKYEVRAHDKTFTAQGLARIEHVSGKEVAKIVLLKTDKGAYAMAVLPAHKLVDLAHFKAASGTAATLAPESDFQTLFPDCEIGAMPPFGNLYNMPVYADEALAKDEEIEFNAGTHTEAIRMKFADFERLSRPKICKLTAN